MGTRSKPLLSAAGLMAIAVAVAFGLAHATPSGAQAQPQANTPSSFSWKYKYDVVSIKPTGPRPTPYPGEWRGVYLFETSPDGLTIRRATLVALAMGAYTGSGNPWLRNDQVLGAPSWADTESFAIDAKMDESVAEELNKLTPPQQALARAQMLQAILADRFKLAVHIENREDPVYFLVVAKNGPKLKEATPGEAYPKNYPGMPGLTYRAGLVVMAPPDPGSEKRMGLGATMDTLANNLSMRLQRTVVDKTGLTGKYDFQLNFHGTGIENTETDPVSSWPPLLTAIQQQLGLKLEPGKGPVPVLVIDHSERPSGN